MKTSIEFFLDLVEMARILVVFLRKHRKSRRKRQAKACGRSGQPAKISDEWLSTTMERQHHWMSGAPEEIREKLLHEVFVLDDKISVVEAELFERREEMEELRGGGSRTLLEVASSGRRIWSRAGDDIGCGTLNNAMCKLLRFEDKDNFGHTAEDVQKGQKRT